MTVPSQGVEEVKWDDVRKGPDTQQARVCSALGLYCGLSSCNTRDGELAVPHGSWPMADQPWVPEWLWGAVPGKDTGSLGAGWGGHTWTQAAATQAKVGTGPALTPLRADIQDGCARGEKLKSSRWFPNCPPLIHPGMMGHPDLLSRGAPKPGSGLSLAVIVSTGGICPPPAPTPSYCTSLHPDLSADWGAGQGEDPPKLRRP